MAKKTTALAKWDEELAKAAEEAAGQEANTGGGQFFSLRGGTLKLNDSPVPDNEMVVIVLDSILENVYYEGDFDPEVRAAPTCYAFGRKDEEMQPHEQVEDKQAESCEACEWNKWGSAAKGRGKACRNRRRLALIPAGTLSNGDFEAYEDEDHYSKAQVAYLNLPPTSINGYGAYVKQLYGALKRPPYAVFTKISLVDDEKSQFKVVFESMGNVPDELIATVMARHKQERTVIEFPYAKPAEEAPAPKRGNQKPQQRKAAPRSKF